jgi:hypothetical protein
MEELEFASRVYAYAFYAVAVGILAISIASGNYLASLISACLIFASAVYYKSGHIINNLLIKRSRVIELINGYKLSSNLAALTKRSGELYVGVSAAVLVFDGAVDISPDTLCRLLESIHEQFEFSFTAMQVDKKRLIDSLDLRRRMQEIRLAKINAQKYDKANQIRREIQILESEISSVRDSGKAFDTIIKIRAFSSEKNETEAATQSLKSIERICSSFFATTKLNYEIIKGERLLAFAGGA